MNIGLFTWFNEDRNCGQTLQAYALEHALEKEYFANVVLINYKYLYLRRFYQNNIMFNVRKIHINIQNRTLIRQFIFDRFVRGKMKCSRPLFSKSQVEKYLKANHINNLMLGSDQLWNPETGVIPDVMLLRLDCGQEIHKFSYSPSMCAKKDREKYITEINRIAQSIDDFDFIGVREDNAKEWLEECLIEKKIAVLLDPVFLLDKNTWITELDINLMGGKYVLIYCLGIVTQSMIRCVDRVQKEKGCPDVLYICTDEIYDIPVQWKKIRNVGPKEFIELVYNASYIVGDSFHMVCFSIIFRKSFLCFRGKRKNFIPNADRIVDLLTSIGLDDRFVDNDEDIKIDIDYDNEIENKIDKRISYSKEKLREMMTIIKKYE